MISNSKRSKREHGLAVQHTYGLVIRHNGILQYSTRKDLGELSLLDLSEVHSNSTV